MSSVRKLYEVKARPSNDPKEVLERAWILWAEANDAVMQDHDSGPTPQQLEDAVELLSSLDTVRPVEPRLREALNASPSRALHVISSFMRAIARKLDVSWNGNDFPPAEIYETKRRPPSSVTFTDRRDAMALDNVFQRAMWIAEANPTVLEALKECNPLRRRTGPIAFGDADSEELVISGQELSSLQELLELLRGTDEYQEEDFQKDVNDVTRALSGAKRPAKFERR